MMSGLALGRRRRPDAQFIERTDTPDLRRQCVAEATGRREMGVRGVQKGPTLVYAGASLIFAGAAFLTGSHSMGIGIGTLMGGAVGVSVLLGRVEHEAWRA